VQALAQGLAHAERNLQRVADISEKTQGGAVAGIEDDAVIYRNIADCHGKIGIEALFERNLPGDRLPGILDDIQEQHAADDGFTPICHAIRPKRATLVSTRPCIIMWLYFLSPKHSDILM
jgi:hypothetical protein